MQKIIESIINILFLGFGSKLKGFRSIIFNGLIAAIALAEFLTDKVHTIMCDNFSIGCESTFWATLASVTAILNAALRYVTDTPVGSSKP